MKSFENLNKEMEKLFIQKLPDYIDKINKQYNDGLILQPFTNTSLEENCIKQPCFKLTFTGGHYTEKDRIIENELYTAKFEIKFEQTQKKRVATFWRYVEAINRMCNEEETDYDYDITEWYDNTIEINIWNRN